MAWLPWERRDLWLARNTLTPTITEEIQPAGLPIHSEIPEALRIRSAGFHRAS